MKVEPCFWFALAMWVTHGVVSLNNSRASRGSHVAFQLAPITSTRIEDSWDLTDKPMILLVLNALLAIGLAMKAVSGLVSRYERPRVTPERSHSSGGARAEKRWSTCVTFRISALLVGWGIGYWVTSLLYVLGSTWHGSRLHHAPTFVTIAGYVLLPGFAIACIFMVADANGFGTRFGAFIKPSVDSFGNPFGAEHWVMATFLRCVLMLSVMFCVSLNGGSIVGPKLFPTDEAHQLRNYPLSLQYRLCF